MAEVNNYGHPDYRGLGNSATIPGKILCHVPKSTIPPQAIVGVVSFDQSSGRSVFGTPYSFYNSYFYFLT